MLLNGPSSFKTLKVCFPVDHISNGDMRFNIIIRSILNFQNYSEISVASGVVIDSNVNHEFNENFIKAKALMDLYQ